jgi:transketolase
MTTADGTTAADGTTTADGGTTADGTTTAGRPAMENVFSTRSRHDARDVMEPALLRLMAQDPGVVVLSADLGASVDELRGRHPDRYFEFGIAETNTISVAAGMAAGGLRPYVVSMAPFGMVKCAEQIRTDLAYTRLPVRIVAKLSGIAMGYFGPSHHATEDIAIGRSIPNLTIAAPSDAASTMALLRQTADLPGPVFIRLSAGITAEVYATEPRLPAGRMARVRPGTDLTVIATGVGVCAALGAAGLLAAEGIDIEVLDAVYLKPLHDAAVLDAMARTGRILTVEEHNVTGGLGSAVADVLARAGAGGHLLVHGLPDEELDVAAPAALLERYGLTPRGVADRARELMSR